MTPPVGDMYLTRQRKDGTWIQPRHLGCVADGSGPNFTGGEFGPSLVTTASGTYLYFSSTGTTGNHDIYRSLRGPDGTFGTPQAVAELNTAAVDQMPNVSRDGTEIVFASSRGGNMDIWTATFDRSSGLWTSPVPVAAVNTSEPETRPSMSGDGKRLYFGRGATADVYRQHSGRVGRRRLTCTVTAERRPPDPIRRPSHVSTRGNSSEDARADHDAGAKQCTVRPTVEAEAGDAEQAVPCNGGAVVTSIGHATPSHVPRGRRPHRRSDRLRRHRVRVLQEFRRLRRKPLALAWGRFRSARRVRFRSAT